MTDDEITALENLAEAATPVERAPEYRVSREGRVFSSTNWRGSGWRELDQTPNSHGYPSVRMLVEGKRKRMLVHRLVAAAFLTHRPSAAHEVRHLDGDKTNNRAVNLAWGTRKENAADRDRHGRTARGARNGWSREAQAARREST